MRVKTKAAININVTITSSINKILYMEVGHYVYSNNFSKIEVDGTYYYETGSPLTKTIIKRFSRTLDTTEVDSLYNTLVQPVAISPFSKSGYDKEIIYLAGLKLMATEYSIAEVDLEIEP